MRNPPQPNLAFRLWLFSLHLKNISFLFFFSCSLFRVLVLVCFLFLLLFRPFTVPKTFVFTPQKLAVLPFFFVSFNRIQQHTSHWLHLFRLAGVLLGVDTLGSGVGALLELVATAAGVGVGVGVGVSAPRLVRFGVGPGFALPPAAGVAAGAGVGVGVGVEGAF